MSFMRLQSPSLLCERDRSLEIRSPRLHIYHKYDYYSFKCLSNSAWKVRKVRRRRSGGTNHH